MSPSTSISNTLVIGILVLLATVSCNEQTKFQRLEAEETGVTFSNRVTPNDTLNVINYTNMYNGGGVAVADFNEDGRQDIYFTGNMVENELYLNEGEFKFRDVTAEANVEGKDRWSSGVAAVDINSDGLMDLYVCATTYDDPRRRANLLYINEGVNDQGVPVFEEKAAEYNLADTTKTTMAAFFDYDNDGDLDVYLLVNKFTRNSSMDRYHEKMTQGESVTTDRLYRNEGADSLGHPRFTNVSEEAGILMEGFGLGVNISDINQDGWKDIYVSNDFITNEVVYINNGDGTFTNRAGEIFKHTVHASMGNDIADINNDSRPDVIMLDMRPGNNYRKKNMLQPNDYSTYVNNEKYGYDYQYVRNQLHLHRGAHPDTGLPVYSDIGMHAGISETDWSWTPSVADFDNDGWRDIIITNGFPRDITDHDFAEYVTRNHRFESNSEMLSKAPSVKLKNYVYKNNGDLTFTDVTEEWGMKAPSFSNGAVYSDLDNDGDLDYVVNNINDSAFVYKNHQNEISPDGNNYLRVRFRGAQANTMGLGALVKIEYGDGKTQYYEHTTYRGYLSSVEPVAHFGLGSHKVVDKMTVTWPRKKTEVIKAIKANQVITVNAKDAKTSKEKVYEEEENDKSSQLLREITKKAGTDYVHKESDYNDFSVQPLLPHKLSQYGPGLSVGDVNNDGLDDIYVSGSLKHNGTFLVQQNDGSFLKQERIVGKRSEHRREELGSLFFDADGDGDDDLYVVSGGYEQEPGSEAYRDRLFINEDGRYKVDKEALPNNFSSSGSSVQAADFDRDGDLDLFVGGRVKPHEYPKPVDSYLLENVSEDGRVRFKIVNDEKAPLLNKIGMISDALWTDFNNDGWIDLVLAGEWMSLRFLQNDSGRFVDVTESTGLSSYKGWWNSLCSGDFDNDGDTDYISGNLGTNTHFQASDQYPLRIYGNDFDNNGTFDAVPSIYYKKRDGGKMEVPFHGLQDLSEQIPAMNQAFDSHHALATASVGEVLSKFDTTGTLVYRANYMKSSYIENREGNTFQVTALPDKVQWAPIYGCVAQDVNNDGNLDVILNGNDYGMEISTGRHDALNGLVLLGDGTGDFDVLDFEESGFFVPGDGKALVTLRGAGGAPLIAASQNRGPLKLFRNSQSTGSYKLRPMDAVAVLNYRDSTRRKVELSYGSSFLSSSGRFIPISENVKSIDIKDYQGNSRTVSFERKNKVVGEGRANSKN